MGSGYIVGIPERRDAHVARAHAERPKDPLDDEVIVALVRRSRDELPCGQKHDVVVAELRAEAPGRLLKAKTAQDLFAVPAEAIPDEFAAIETTSVGEQIPHGHLSGDLRIVELKSGHVVD